MKFIATLLAVAAIVGLSSNAFANPSETRAYNTSIGVSVLGAGASGNILVFGPGTFTTAPGVTTASVVAEDLSQDQPYMTVCVDKNGNGICQDSEGDIQANGYGIITVSDVTPFTNIIVFVYALAVDETGAHTGTTCTVTVTWG